MTKKKRKNAFKDDLDSEYIGNVFGWKTSIIGLIVIGAFIGLYFFLSKMNQSQASLKNNNPVQKEQVIKNDVDSLN